jgi:hypothetical protein
VALWIEGCLRGQLALDVDLAGALALGEAVGEACMRRAVHRDA